MAVKKTFKFEKITTKSGKEIRLRVPTWEGAKRHKCNGQCIYALSESCACQCGGLNHGGGFDATGARLGKEQVLQVFGVVLEEPRKKKEKKQ